MCSAVSIGREVAPRIAPGVRARIVDVYFVGRIGLHSASTHHIRLPVEGQPTRFASGSRYSRNRANAVSYWIEAERGVRRKLSDSIEPCEPGSAQRR